MKNESRPLIFSTRTKEAVFSVELLCFLAKPWADLTRLPGVS